jgi:hypothetical protein
MSSGHGHSTSEFGPAAGDETQLRANLTKFQMLALVVGILALAVCAGAAFSGGSSEKIESFYRAYLYGYVFWMGLSLGSGGICMINNLTAGKWGLAARRVTNAANFNIIFMAVMGLPLLYAIHSNHLYGWAGFGPDPHLGPHKAIWFSVGNVTLRSILCFSIWIITALMIAIGAKKVEESGRFAVAKIFAGLSAFGLILYVLTMTVMCVDWVMSFTPDWFSTMFTLIFLMGQMLSAFCFAVFIGAYLNKYEPVHGKISADQYNDLGSFMFAFVILWSYMSFAQLLITWMGGLKSEMGWYAPRFEGNWLVVGLTLMLLQFLLPFLVLMNKPIKRNPAFLQKIAFFLLAMRFVDLAYLLKPSLSSPRVSWMDFIAPFGIGGLYMFMFLWKLKAGRLAPPPLVNEYTAAEVDHASLVGATDYGAAITGRKGPVP